MSGVPLTFEKVKEYIENIDSYKLLSTDYQDRKQKLKIQCPDNHEYETTFYNFKRGSRCRKCFNENRKLTLEEIKEHIESFEGYILLSDNYDNITTNLKIKCPKNHEFEMVYRSFKRGRRCQKCFFDDQRLSYDYVKTYIENVEGYKLISDEYINARLNLKLTCPEKHNIEMTFTSFKDKESRCNICSYKIIANKLKHSYEFVKEYIENVVGYKLISKEYVNNEKKILIECPEKHIIDMTFSNFQKGNRCRICKYINDANNYKLSYEFVKDYIENSIGYKLLSTEYINNETKLDFECPDKHKFKMTFAKFKNSNQRCSKCYKKTQKMVYTFVEETYQNIISEAKFEWCKNITYLPFDFLLDDYKLLLEVDGRQHFEQVYNWKSPKETQERDIYKMKLALEHGYSIIRISQEDILNNTLDWKELLNEKIKKYKKSKVIYISKDENLYDNHKITY